MYHVIHQYIPIHELQYIDTSEHNITAALTPVRMGYFFSCETFDHK